MQPSARLFAAPAAANSPSSPAAAACSPATWRLLPAPKNNRTPRLPPTYTSPPLLPPSPPPSNSRHSQPPETMAEHLTSEQIEHFRHVRAPPFLPPPPPLPASPRASSRCSQRSIKTAVAPSAPASSAAVCARWARTPDRRRCAASARATGTRAFGCNYAI